MQNQPILIKHVQLTMPDHLVLNGWLLVADGLIRAIGEGEPPENDLKGYDRQSLQVQDRQGLLVMPGFIDTPIAIEGNLKYRNISREDLYKERESRIPLKGGMGTAWDTAYAALFFASDESKFVTGATLTVDGGQSSRIG